VGAKAFGRGKLLGSAKKLLNLFIAIDVRGLSPVTVREESCGRNPAGGISVRGSITLYQIAKRRMMPKR
jgi:hypothetical protein